MITIEQLLFDKVHEVVCGSRCPGVKKTGERWAHTELCDQMAALNGGKGPYRAGTQLFGYFDSPQQTEPTLQADLGAPCPLCWAMLDRADMKTISMMPISDAAGDHTPDGIRLDYIEAKGDKCYFYRVHKSCYEKATEQAKTEAEDYIWTLIEGKTA